MPILQQHQQAVYTVDFIIPDIFEYDEIKKLQLITLAKV